MFHHVWYGPVPVHRIEAPKVPWLWVGAVYPHETLDATSKIEEVVRIGDKVDNDYLSSATGYDPMKWKYLDMETLEEKDFPSDGFVIGENETTDNNATRKDDST